jgi:hypothetical protein
LTQRFVKWAVFIVGERIIGPASLRKLFLFNTSQKKPLIAIHDKNLKKIWKFSLT